MTKFDTRWALAACLALLAACSRHEPPAPAKTVAAAVPAAPAAMAPRELDGKRAPEIMHAIFGDAYDASARKAIAAVEENGEESNVVMTFVSAATLPDGRVAAIVNGTMADENDQEIVAHPEPGMLNVYVLRTVGTTWEVVQRHENADQLGTNGHMGSVHWVAIGPGKPGFIASSGGMWQGYSIDFADVFELGTDVRNLGNFKQAGSNEGACGPDLSDCWDVGSHIRFDPTAQRDGYHDILVDFSGKHYTVSEDKDGKDVEHVKTSVRQTVRYRFDGKAYAVVTGTNPVPDI